MSTFSPLPATAQAVATAPLPGRGLGVAGFVLSLLGALSPVGLILSIVSLVQAKRSHRGNALAVWGIVLGAIGTVEMIVATIAAFANFTSAGELCSISELIAVTCR